MYLTVTFEKGGKIGIYASYDGTTISISTEANNLQRMLPGAVYEAVIVRLTMLLEVQGVQTLKFAS